VDAFTLRPGDETYPRLLLDYREPPRLRIRGRLPSAPGVAIVGTRKATRDGVAFATHLGSGLADAGVAVWSGGAVGIDTAAHVGCLTAGGVTVVVLGGGLDRLFPPENEALFARIVESGGALVSMVDDAVEPLPQYFIERNGLLARATRATIVVEAPARSGARNATASARKAGRPVGAVPHAPWAPRGAGCLLDLEQGAQVVIGVDSVLRIAGLELGRTGALFPPDPTEQLGEPERAVARAVLEGARSVDALCERTGLPVWSVAQAVVALACAGLVRDDPGGLVPAGPLAR
jgi:DNA processing protein